MKKLLAGYCIHRTRNGIKVYQNFFYRWFTFNSKTLQTVINRYRPEKISLDYIKYLTLNLRLNYKSNNCCILGLGGGAAAHAICKYAPAANITAVELSEDIINIAKKYFMLNKIKHLTIIQQDANIFMQQQSKSFENILIDLYDKDQFPINCKHPDFFKNCYNSLLANGVLAINLANTFDHFPIFIELRNLFKQNIVCVQVKKTCNLIILAYKVDSMLYVIQQLQQSQLIKKIAWDPKWGYIAE